MRRVLPVRPMMLLPANARHEEHFHRMKSTFH